MVDGTGKLSEVSLKDVKFAKATLAGRLNVPRVRAIQVDGHNAVYYSRDVPGGEEGGRRARNVTAMRAGATSRATIETRAPLPTRMRAVSIVRDIGEA